MRTFLFAALCINGLLHTFTTCDCQSGYTGEYCEADLLSHSASGSGSGVAGLDSNEPELSRGSGDGLCVNGVLVYHDYCICNFGYTGPNCDTLIVEDDDAPEKISNEQDSDSEDDALERELELLAPSAWSRTFMDELSWKIIPISKYSISSSVPISEETILRNKFAVASVGIEGTKSELHTARDPGDHNSIVYRFSFVSNVLGAKARLELTTCFTRASDLIKRYKEIPKETEQLMKTSCPVIHLPLDHVHTYEYEIFIAKGDISVDGHYVITQWHGSADPTILRDQNKCIAQVTMKEIHKLCSKRFCAQGEIFDHGDQFIGINYNQGGYPPLTMTLHDGYFIITARSDERVFMEKGGCSKGGTKSVRCPDHPRQQLHILWRLPAKKFKFDRWVKFRWEIKWSKYSSVGGNYSNPGLLTSNALIRVWMDGENIVDWNGPCGRNDAGRIPYFKIGIYNPSGSQSPVRFYVRRYNHNHNPVSRHPDPQLRRAAGNLTVCAREQGVVNRNAVKSAKKCSFGLLSSAAEKSLQCVLHAEKDYLAFLLSARFSKMVIDGYTKKIISHLIYEVENQNLKIKSLESKLGRYEELLHRMESEDVGSHSEL